MWLCVCPTNPDVWPLPQQYGAPVRTAFKPSPTFSSHPSSVNTQSYSWGGGVEEPSLIKLVHPSPTFFFFSRRVYRMLAGSLLVSRAAFARTACDCSLMLTITSCWWGDCRCSLNRHNLLVDIVNTVHTRCWRHASFSQVRCQYAGGFGVRILLPAFVCLFFVNLF